MKAKENVKNDNLNLQADTLTNLPLADEQADETKGGNASDRSAGLDIIVGANGAPGGHVK